VLYFNRDGCCHLVLCLQLILFHYIMLYNTQLIIQGLRVQIQPLALAEKKHELSTYSLANQCASLLLSGILIKFLFLSSIIILNQCIFVTAMTRYILFTILQNFFSWSPPLWINKLECFFLKSIFPSIYL